MLWCSPTPVTSLEFALTKNAPVSALECAPRNSLDLKPPEMNTYRKWGVSPLLLAFCKSWFVNRCSSVFICDYTFCLASRPAAGGLFFNRNAGQVPPTAFLVSLRRVC